MSLAERVCEHVAEAELTDEVALDLVCSLNELVDARRAPVAEALHRLRAALEDDPRDARLGMRVLLLEAALATGQFR